MDEKRFSGWHVAITGGASGIGRATARRFATDGATLVSIIDRSEPGLQDTVKEIESIGTRIMPMMADLGSRDACREAMERVIAAAPRLHVLVSNAAVPAYPIPFLETDLRVWDVEVAVNLNASFILGQLAAKAMTETGGGSILYTASVAGMGASRGFTPYSVTKAGIIALVRQMAVELAPWHIRVNAVSPGPADTPRSVDLVGAAAMERLRRAYPGIPLNRLATADDIANAFAYLASDEAGYITGHNLVVDGGLTATTFETVDREH